MSEMKIKALAPWFGGNRIQADIVGRELGRLGWCGVFFCGGLPELPGIRTQAGVCTDLHRHVINLARVVSDGRLLARMLRAVDRLVFHPDVLAIAQRRCQERELERGLALFGTGGELDAPDVGWAADYFVACWMGRGGYAGREGELSQSISVRWTASGGSSAKRWRSAVESLPAWGRVLDRWQFVCMDAFEALDSLRKKQKRAGLYLDPPWRFQGDRYCHPFTDAHHRRLARKLNSIEGYRIVVRYGDDPLIRELYSDPKWRWVESVTTNQQGGNVREVLIVNGPSLESKEE